MINKRFLGKGGIVDYQTSNTAYDKLAFIADNYPDMVKMYDTIMAHLKLPSGGGECLFETREVTFIPYYIAINKDFFEDDTTTLKPMNLTPKQMFGGTPEEIAKRIKGNDNGENAERVFSNAVYIDTVSRTTTSYRYVPSKGHYDTITETKEYYVFAIDSPAEGGVECYFNSNLYKYYKDDCLSEQTFSEYFYGYPDSSGKEKGSNMFFYILSKNPNVSSDDYTVWDCVDMCKKYEDFTFTEVIPKGNAVMTYLGGI